MMTMIENVKQPLTKCPECAGRGEVEYNVTRSEWGVWECDTDECVVCAGNGEVTLWVADDWMDWS